MIQIGTADYQGAPVSATRSNLGTLYRSEPLITRAAKASLATDPACPDCTHDFSDHHPENSDSGCTVAGCICTLTRQDMESDQEGTDQ